MRRVIALLALGALVAVLVLGCKPKQEATTTDQPNPPGKIGAGMGPKAPK